MTDQRADIDYSAVENLPELLDVLSRNGVPEDRLWDYVSAFQSIKAREAGIPLSGQFELTPLCNLDCKMCYVHLDQDQLRGASPLQPEQWKDIMAQAHSMGMMYATLTGGECLTYPGFEEVYLFLRSMGIRTSLITNGVLLDRKWMDFFSKHPPAGMTVSLYGSSGEAYQSVTGHDIFDAVYSHLLALKKAEFPVTVGITPSAYMLQDIPDLLKLVRQLDFSFVVNVALFVLAKQRGDERFGSVALVLGLVGALAWTVFLWPVMTGTSTGAYVVYVNGVASGGGLVAIMQGVVPFFIFCVALLALPRMVAYVIVRIGWAASGRQKIKGPSKATAQVIKMTVAIFCLLYVLFTPLYLRVMGTAALVPAAILLVVGILCLVSWARGRKR